MQWDDLRVFLAVADTRSLRQAAGALRVGQPTIVRRLRQLERALNARLFERTPDGHRLTQAREDLLPLARNMAETAIVIDRRQIALSDEAGGVVRLAAGEWPARFLAPKLATFAAAHPDVIVERTHPTDPPS
jgi:DNA-binding transcriptional LysR family regulator